MSGRRNTVYALIIIALAAGLFTGRAFLFNLAYLLAALYVVAALWAWLSIRWIGVARKTRARRAQVGRDLSEVFTVSNLAILPKLWLEIRDFSELPAHRASHVVPALSPRGKYRWYVETPCIARGEFRLGPITILSGDPFGLFLSSRKLGSTSHVVVYPATVEVNQFHLPMGLLSGGEAQRRRAHFVTTNAVGVREYAPGDSFNRIHWRTTARRDKLMVKEFELDPLVDIWMLVDFSSSSLYEAPGLRRVGNNGPVIPDGPGVPDSTEEYVVVLAASLSKHFIESQRALGFVAYLPHREVHQAERGDRQLSRILQSLAVARSHSSYSLGEMLALETPYLTRGTTLVIVTASTQTDWIGEAQILARRGIRPMCVWVNQASFGVECDAATIRGTLRLANIPTVVINRGDDLTAALQQRPE